MLRIFTKKNRILLVELVRTDFKLRYQGSALGYFWAFLRPLFMFAILYIVFGLILRFGNSVPNFPVYLLLGIVLWQFFVEATKRAMNSIVSRGDLIRKINFPKYIIVISGTVSALINLLFNLLVVLIFIVISGAQIQPQAIVVFPLLLMELYAFSLALGFYLATVNVRYRDISHIWDILLQGGFYASAIFYPISLVVERSELAARVLFASPITQIIQDSRYVLVTDQTSTIYSFTGAYLYYLLPLGVIAAISVSAIYYFRRRSPYFAEDI